MEEDGSVMLINGFHRPHHRVLKPPGGETHDIFGTNSYQTEALPHRNTNHLQSSVFADAAAAPAGQAPVSTSGKKHGNYSAGASSIVFGSGVVEEDEQQQPRKVKDYQKSNVFGDQNEPSYLNGNSGIRRYNASAGLANSQVFPTGPAMTPRTAARRGAGNPITGEGYVNGAAPSNANGNGEQAKENGQNNSGVRIRNPPGGHSTKLW